MSAQLRVVGAQSIYAHLHTIHRPGHPIRLNYWIEIAAFSKRNKCNIWLKLRDICAIHAETETSDLETQFLPHV